MDKQVTWVHVTYHTKPVFIEWDLVSPAWQPITQSYVNPCGDCLCPHILPQTISIEFGHNFIFINKKHGLRKHIDRNVFIVTPSSEGLLQDNIHKNGLLQLCVNHQIINLSEKWLGKYKLINDYSRIWTYNLPGVSGGALPTELSSSCGLTIFLIF